MSANDPNRAQLVAVARALGSLADDVVFVGGATVGLLVTDPAAPSIRPTKDVDVVVEVASYADYQHRIGSALRQGGFVECTDDGAPICAWEVRGIRVDVMPTDAAVLGFSNPWYQRAIAAAKSYDLEGASIRLIAAPHFLATKFVAFENRGDGDYHASHDLEDILAVVDGRASLASEMAMADAGLRDYVVESIGSLLASDEFRSALPGHVEDGREGICLQRLRAVGVTRTDSSPGT